MCQLTNGGLTLKLKEYISILDYLMKFLAQYWLEKRQRISITFIKIMGGNMSKNRCCGCKKYFNQETMIKLPVGYFCLLQCSIDYATRTQKRSRERQAKTKLKADKERIKTRSQYIKDAQTWFNKFIRLRDKDLPCICCDRPNTNDIQWHAGHFLTTGARPEHRFNEHNCHKQTSYCNNHLSGNVAEYRKRLIIKIGLKAVEIMERDHKPKKYTIDELKVIIQDYKDKCKLLK